MAIVADRRGNGGPEESHQLPKVMCGNMQRGPDSNSETGTRATLSVLPLVLQPRTWAHLKCHFFSCTNSLIMFQGLVWRVLGSVVGEVCADVQLATGDLADQWLCKVCPSPCHICYCKITMNKGHNGESGDGDEGEDRQEWETSCGKWCVFSPAPL